MLTRSQSEKYPRNHMKRMFYAVIKFSNLFLFVWRLCHFYDLISTQSGKKWVNLYFFCNKHMWHDSRTNALDKEIWTWQIGADE